MFRAYTAKDLGVVMVEGLSFAKYRCPPTGILYWLIRILWLGLRVDL